jgi:hypothetical protein
MITLSTPSPTAQLMLSLPKRSVVSSVKFLPSPKIWSIPVPPVIASFPSPP